MLELEERSLGCWSVRKRSCRGWFNEPYRHSLAAKGIRTSYVFKSTGSPFEVFKSPEEKSDLGKSMVDRVVDKKVVEVEDFMNQHNVSFEDKKRIIDHYIAPIIERFKSGRISEEQFNEEIDSKLRHNLKASQRELKVFDWSDDGVVDKNGYGVFNFLDRAKRSSFAQKVTPIFNENSINRLIRDELVENKRITLGDRIFGWGIIRTHKSVEKMQKINYPLSK